MARASTTGGKKSKAKARKASLAKGRRTAKAAKTKRRIGPAAKPSKGRSVSELEARLKIKTRELDEALAQQSATAEVLQVVSNSSGDLPLVFDTMLDKAMHLCGAEFGVLAIYDGKTFRTAAARGLPGKYVAYRARSTGDYGPGTAPFQHLQGEPIVHTVDLMDSDAYRAGEPNRRALVDLGGARCLLCVPLLSDREVIGCVMIFRQEARPFGDRQIALLKHFAAQAVVAIKNARLLNETKEALEQQTATAEILRVINSSPGNLTPVFRAILEKAHNTCGADMGSLFAWDGTHTRAVATLGYDAEIDEILRKPHLPIPAMVDLMSGQRIFHRVYEQDRAKEGPHEFGPRFLAGSRIRTNLIIPLRKDDTVLGFISANRREVRPYKEKEIALLESFAAQAVIAMENARLLGELRERTEDLSESLQQQTATAEVLKVISRSAFDLDTVLKSLIGTATRLCNTEHGQIFRREGEIYRYAASVMNLTPEYLAIEKRIEIRPGRGSLVGRVAQEKCTVQIVDALEDPDYDEKESARIGGVRTMLGVPMLRDGEPIGTFALARTEVRPFTQREVELVTTFADQAVIALENARLFNETQESLARQAATSEILRVVSQSPTDVQPVFETIVMTAVRLLRCDGSFILRCDGTTFAAVAAAGPEGTYRVFNPAPRPIDPEADFPSRAITTRRNLHLPDWSVIDLPEFERQIHQTRGYNSALFLPLLRGEDCIGVIGLASKRPNNFSETDIALAESFRDQALIAIENARLFNETKEALERQTATAEILKVISSSPSDVQPVFEAIATSANKLIGGLSTTVFSVVDDMVHLSAFTPTSPAADSALKASFPRPLSTRTWNEDIRVGRTIQIPDTEIEYADEPDLQEMARKRGFRGLVIVPLLRDRLLIGTINVTRAEPGRFSDHHIGLLQTFADQAVIAIENVRLFNETKEALEQQKASADILSVISNSVANAQPVFNKILESCKRLFGGDELDVLLVDEQGQMTIAAYIGDFHDVVAATFPAPVERTPAGQAIRDRRVIHWPDLVNGDDVPGVLRKMAAMIGYRSMAFAPMLWENRGIGAIGVARSTGPFKPKELTMLQTFADQAVIAIQNARLFTEVQSRTRDLSEALTSQTASSNILSVIASSPTDVGPALQAIVESASQLCGAYDAVVVLRNGDELTLGAHHGSIPLNRVRWANDRTSVSGRAIIDRSPIHILDVTSDEGRELQTAQEMSQRDGGRTVLGVPLLREGESIGAIVLRRTEVQAFNNKQIALLQTFADQAVIAIGNVRLFDEVQARTRELAASLDDLRAAQDRLVQTEKLASLGQLTAGIAHEIKNPLNFVNNFSSVSADLIDELNETLAPAPLDRKMRGDIAELTQMLKSNLEKVVQHGKRADSIVKNMLLHSREGSGEHRSTDVNSLVEESLNLAYHGARAEMQTFNNTLGRNLDPDAGSVELYPQEITRALLNLISNGFYAATKRKAETDDPTFDPILSAATKNRGESVEIRIRDNGTGIPSEVKEKIFNPFFTTKPAGEGTGLGLSMTHDIIVKQHGGRIEVETEPGVCTEFVITLPRVTAKKID